MKLFPLISSIADMEKKDYFSRQSKQYAAFRPTYPEPLYQFIFEHVENRSCAWDCATGNGQVARYLASYFDKVYATDISRQQLDHAFRARNIFYSASPAERTSFPDGNFDLITVAQALHWFDLSLFYQEVKRTAKRNGLLAVWGYGLLSVDATVDHFFIDFYKNQTGPYWDVARKLVDSRYREIPFPFEEIPCPDFAITIEWSLGQFAGYLNSWSAVQKYISKHGANPVDAFIENLALVWKPAEVKVVSFPVFLKLGRTGG